MTMPTGLSRAVRRGAPPSAEQGAALTPRRRLQLVLAGLWVLDGLLKLQPYMFTKDFAPMGLGEALDGAPGWLASAIRGVSGIEQRHSISAMTVFALIELAIGFGIAWPRTVRFGLAACLVWVPFLWVFGEGLGALASGHASAFTGAPGASVLYALLAVLLWPVERDGSSEAERFVGRRPARALWVVLWGLLAFLAFLPVNTAPHAFSDAIAGNAEATPSGYAWLLDHATSAAQGHGQLLGIVFGSALVLVALSVLAPWPRAARAGIVLALALATLIWVFGEGFGMPFQGMATDPGSGPLLAVIALVYLPARRPAGQAGTVPGALAEGAAA